MAGLRESLYLVRGDLHTTRQGPKGSEQTMTRTSRRQHARMGRLELPTIAQQTRKVAWVAVGERVRLG